MNFFKGNHLWPQANFLLEMKNIRREELLKLELGFVFCKEISQIYKEMTQGIL